MNTNKLDLFYYLLAAKKGGGGGGGSTPTLVDIVLNDDGTMTATYSDETESEIIVTYDGDKISQIKIDNTVIIPEYDDEDICIKLGNCTISGLENYKGVGIQKTIASSELNEDGSFTITYEDGTVETAAPTYDDDGKLTSLVVDGKTVGLTYDGDNVLISIGDSSVEGFDQIPGVTLLDYTVTFKSDDEDYYISSCKSGKVVSEPPIPTSESGTFSGWKNGEDLVTFPLTPTSDLTLDAYYQLVRSGMATNVAGTLIASNIGTKTNAGLMVYGLPTVTRYNQIYPMMVAKSTDAMKTSKFTSISGEVEFTYDGETWYYYIPIAGTTGFDDGDLTLYYEAGSYYNFTTDERLQCANKILDHYFMKD